MLEEILKLIAGMAGLGAFTSMLINLLKAVGLVKDGQSEKAFKIADLVVFVVVMVLYLTRTPIDWAEVDQWLILLTALLGYVVSVFSGEITHDTIKGTPLVGYSYSEKKLKKITQSLASTIKILTWVLGIVGAGMLSWLVTQILSLIR